MNNSKGITNTAITRGSHLEPSSSVTWATSLPHAEAAAAARVGGSRTDHGVCAKLPSTVAGGREPVSLSRREKSPRQSVDSSRSVPCSLCPGRESGRRAVPWLRQMFTVKCVPISICSICMGFIWFRLHGIECFTLSHECGFLWFSLYRIECFPFSHTCFLWFRLYGIECFTLSRVWFSLVLSARDRVFHPLSRVRFLWFSLEGIECFTLSHPWVSLVQSLRDRVFHPLTCVTCNVDSMLDPQIRRCEGIVDTAAMIMPLSHSSLTQSPSM